MSLSRDREAQRRAQNAVDQRLREGHRTYVLTYGMTRILAAGDSQRDVRDKLSNYYRVRHLAAPPDNEVTVREARPGEAAEFERHRATPVETARMFPIDTIPTRVEPREYG